jgi:hypothetical protein
MIKQSLLFILLVTGYFFRLDVACAQNLIFEKHFGGGGDDGIYDLVVDQNNDIYVLGWYSGQVDLNPGAGVDLANGFGNRDIFLAKYDSNGNYLWGFGMGGSLQDEGSSLAIDSSNNVVMIGRFSGTVDFDPSPSFYIANSSGSRDAFFAKFSPQGLMIWAKKFGGNLYDDAEDVVVDELNCIYLAGSFQSTVDFNPDTMLTISRTSFGLDDCYVAKFDSNGVLIWVNTFGGVGSDDVGALQLDGRGGVYCAGYYSGITDFDGGVTQNLMTAVGNSDIFLCKFDTAGALQWVTGTGSVGFDAAFGIEIYRDKVYLTGVFSQSIDFDPGSGVDMKNSFGDMDVFIAQYDTLGTYLWVEQSGGTGADVGMDISIDDNHRIVATGLFRSTSVFNGGGNSISLSAAGDRDIYVSFIDSSGYLIEVFPVSSIGVENIRTVIATNNSQFFISGFYGGVADFDPDSGASTSTVCMGITDAFFAKYGFYSCDSLTSVGAISGASIVCEGDTIMYSVPPVAGATEYNWNIPLGWQEIGYSTNTIILVPQDSGGQISVTVSNDCFSLISYLFTVTLTDTIFEHHFDSACVGSIYVFPDGSVGTSDTIHYSRFTDVNGCDSVIVTTLTFFNTFSIVNNVTICAGSSYTVNGNTYTLAGTYYDTLLNSLGCDSVIETNLSIIPQNLFLQSVNICDGDTLYVGSTAYTTGGIYIDTLVSAAFCDSIVISNLQVNMVDTSLTIIPGTFTSNQAGAIYQWCECTINSLAPIPGAVNQSFVLPFNGNFSVIINWNGCVDTSACLNSILSGNVEVDLFGDLKMFPNPVQQSLVIESENELTGFKLFAIDSRKILNHEFPFKQITVDLSGFADGIYILQVSKKDFVLNRLIYKN